MENVSSVTSSVTTN